MRNARRIEAVPPSMSPSSRWCCLLSKKPLGDFPLVSALWPETVVDASRLDHVYGTGPLGYLFGDWAEHRREISGVIYTCRGGFIDLGHVRDNIDNTRYYFLALSKLRPNARYPVSFDPASYDGEVRVHDYVPPAERLAVARSMAYDESIWHELDTFDTVSHVSAFSPEDLVSNFLGTYVGAKAIELMQRRGDEFDRAVTEVLTAVLSPDVLRAVPVQTTLDALTRVERWFDFPPPVLDVVIPDALWTSYLQRRNFAWRPIQPWVLDDVEPGISTRWPAEIERQLPDVRSHYTARYGGTETNPVGSTDALESHILQKMLDAERRYGSDFNDPSPARVDVN